jgi:hypothetical protein
MIYDYDYDIKRAKEKRLMQIESERKSRVFQLKRELVEGARELKRITSRTLAGLQLAAGTETDTCGLFAAKECWRRFKEDFPCGVLRFEYPKGHEAAGEGHAVCVYQLPEKTMLVYEPGSGSANVGRVGWDAAKVAEGFCKGALRARWIAKP